MQFKDLIKKLGFVPKENASGVFQKRYQQCDNYCIEIDIDNAKFNYGQLIIAGAQTTLNFSQAENWVVLECVNRLLEKGYKPKNISLEKVYPAGHGFSGRLDICVSRDDGSEYLLIECKTYGKELDKAVVKLNKDGGQLFTYFKFSSKADVIMLYASELNAGNIIYKNEIVKIEEDYRTGDVKDFYDKWNKLTKDNGIFDPWVTPYQFVSKALNINLLEPIKQEDSSFIFNRFLEILRHNVVSDKPNAFNKIFTLFLCKIYDEKSKEDSDDELDFQWKEGVDDDMSFQLRLTDLYKNGMYEFLEKRVTDFSEAEFENKFKNLDESVKSALLTEFKKIRLEKNNEFAIKEVYDGKSFKENAKVVKEVVELLQGFKIRYTKKQQYLSDFFELLLTTGLKQESGQFFTPVPIAQFIIKSLPIDSIVEEKLQNGEGNNLLPFVMDYAAGSGHFLTETMHEIQRLIDQKNDKKYNPSTAKKIRNWKDDHFEWALNYVYGIEKDYRLVKVGKVGCYLHGDGLANVLHSDGLANFNHPDYKGKLKYTDKDFPTDNKQFEILVSNPPYSVSAFKNASREYYRENDFSLYERLTDNSSEIECLFIERTKQLLKDGGVAGIILPSSVLSNTGIYSKSREILLQYFDIVAIVELGSNTFMATGTNTVVLFLRRRNNYQSVNLKIAIDDFFKNLRDVTLNGIEKPVTKYVQHVWKGILLEDYVTLLNGNPNSAIIEHSIFSEYKRKIKSKNEKDFWDIVIEKEKEKLFYFIVVFRQKVVVIKSGEKDAEKYFLGYEFSNRRGSEGIHAMQRGKSIDECTSLFDPEVFDNPVKASTYIYKAFNGDFDFSIDKSLENNISRNQLLDMLTFDRVEFEKSISLSKKKKVTIKSKWDIVKIEEIASTQYGYTDKATDSGKIRYLRITDLNDDGHINLHNEAKFVSPSDEIKRQFLLNDNDIVIARSGSVGKSAIYQSDKYDEMIFASYLIRVVANKEKILPKFLFHFTKTQLYWDQVEANSIAVTQPNLNAEKIKDFQIPLPPKTIQEKIVAEIECLEEKEEKLNKEVKNLNIEKKEIINSIFSENNFSEISKIGKVLGGKRIPKGLSFYPEKTNYPYIRVSDFSNGNVDLNNLKYIDHEVFKLIKNYTISENDVYISIAGTIGLVGLIPPELDGKSLTENAAKIVIKDPLIISKEFLFYCLSSDNLQKQIEENTRAVGVPKLALKRIETLQIPVPLLSEQQQIIMKLKGIDSKINILEKEKMEMPQYKEIVLNSYL